VRPSSAKEGSPEPGMTSGYVVSVAGSAKATPKTKWTRIVDRYAIGAIAVGCTIVTIVVEDRVSLS
jgi:hypothetical protein